MPYVLYRSLEVWQQRSQVRMPQEIRPMLEATYAERDEVDGVLIKCKGEVGRNREKLEGLARIGLATGARTLPESKATTRYSETESCEVLLIRKKSLEETGAIVALLNGRTLGLRRNIRYGEPKAWRRVAAELQQNVVLVPEYLAPSTSPQQIQWLKDFVYLGDWEESPFRVAFVSQDGALHGVDGGNALDGYELSYTPHLGYCAKKRSDPAHNDLW
jgi:CRISPR-associated endonuclease/helicase Cas3